MKKNVQSKRRLVPLLLSESELPIAVYVIVIVALITAWAIRIYNPDLSLNLFTELLGAAFTIFIIGELLLRSKMKRWRIVRQHIDYLISRDINRIRDGIATRAFSFDPMIDQGISVEKQLSAIREQRGAFLSMLESHSPEDILSRLRNRELFTEENYNYFHEKANDIWNLLNMKYSEYLDPKLVSRLIQLNTNLNDICGHIRQYQKAERFPEDRDYYYTIGLKGCAVSFKKILGIVNDLKDGGYSVAANVSDNGGGNDDLYRCR